MTKPSLNYLNLANKHSKHDQIHPHFQIAILLYNKFQIKTSRKL